MSESFAKAFAAALASGTDGDDVLESLVRDIKQGLAGKPCDVALLFLTEGFEGIPTAAFYKKFQELTGAAHVLGCNASGVAGGNREFEMEPAASALVMHLPGVSTQTFSFSAAELESFESGPDLVRALDLYPTEGPHFICLGDPMTCDSVGLMRRFNEAYPGRPVAGGLASGNVSGGENRIFLDGEEMLQGACGLALEGPVRFETLVSQGCRPIGQPLAVTRAEENVLQEIGGRPALEVFGEIYRTLSPQDQELAHQSLFVGLAMDEKQADFRRGDFLIRNILGADRESGALAVGEELVIGQTLQFHLRDARSSTEDLEQMLANFSPRVEQNPEGAILVSCAGRGRGLFGVPDHDAGLIQKLRGPLAMAGFFANGEFGPVQGRNFVHGYTTSLTLIR